MWNAIRGERNNLYGRGGHRSFIASKILANNGFNGKIYNKE